MSSKKPDKALELAGKMIEALEHRRAFGGEDYAPTLQQLGELCDGEPSQDLIVKAATKKAFTDRAAVQKVDKKPSLNAPVYFKEDLPKPEVILAKRMAAVLESQRALGDSAYPPTLRRLAELCEVKGPEAAIRKAVSTAPMADRTTVAARKGKTLLLDAPVVFNEDLEAGMATVLAGLLRFALSPVTSKTKKGTNETTAFTRAEMVKRLVPDLRQRLARVVSEGIEREQLPAGIGWVTVKGKPLLFLAERVRNAAVRPAAPTDGHAPHSHRQPAFDASSSHRAFPPHDFVQAFRAAFDILDRRNGSTNFVKLADLRDALSEFNREEFDAGLRTLRMDGIFSLDSHEGLHGSLSHDDREAGVREAGSLLVYASRR